MVFFIRNCYFFFLFSSVQLILRTHILFLLCCVLYCWRIDCTTKSNRNTWLVVYEYICKRINTYTWWLFCRYFFFFSHSLIFPLELLFVCWTRMSSLHSWVSMLVAWQCCLPTPTESSYMWMVAACIIYTLYDTVMPLARYWYRLEFQSIQHQCWCICVQWFGLRYALAMSQNSHVC